MEQVVAVVAEHIVPVILARVEITVIEKKER
jgi:hypothetical protein